MNRPVSRFAVLELVTVGATVLLGWIYSVQQLLRDGWIHGGGTAWMFVLAIVATLGAGIALVAHRAGSHGWTAVGFLAVLVSPTVFDYILNVGVLTLALVEIARAIAGRRQARQTIRAGSARV